MSPAVSAGVRQSTRHTISAVLSAPVRLTRASGNHEGSPDIIERTSRPCRCRRGVIAGLRQGPMSRVRRAHLLTPSSDADRLGARHRHGQPVLVHFDWHGAPACRPTKAGGEASPCRRTDRQCHDEQSVTVKLERSPHLVNAARLTQGGCRPSLPPPCAVAVGQVKVPAFDGTGRAGPMRLHPRFHPHAATGASAEACQGERSSGRGLGIEPVPGTVITAAGHGTNLAEGGPASLVWRRR
jgi:hypothetical protein